MECYIPDMTFKLKMLMEQNQKFFVFIKKSKIYKGLLNWKRI